MFQLPISGKIRSTFVDNVLPNNESTIGFDDEFKVLLSGETTTKSLPAWHSNAHVNDKDYSVNNGLYADALWNPNTKYSVPPPIKMSYCPRALSSCEAEYLR